MDKAGISVTKFDALAQLHRYPEGLSMTTLSELLKVTNGNVSGLVARLLKDGLVERQMSLTDRRSFTTRLAPRGRQVFEAALLVHDAVLSDCLRAVPPQKLGDAAQLLRGISEGLKPGKVAGAHVDDADG